MARYRYLCCHPVNRNQLAPQVRFTGAQWSTVVNGNGAFAGRVAVPDDDAKIAQLKTALEPHYSAVYVKNSAGRFAWGGPIVKQTWDHTSQSVVVEAVEWRTWLYWVFLAPNTNMTTPTDQAYSWSNKDQLEIARDIASKMTIGGSADGRPSIIIGTELSGKLRQLNLKGLNFRRAGEAIDSLAQRDVGFEWTIEVRPHPTDGLPQLYFVPSFPQRGGLVTGMTLKSTSKGGNLLAYGPIVKDTTALRIRQWTTGAGQPPDQPFAQDSAPDLATSHALMREDQTNYSTITQRATLASHARAIRRFYQAGDGLLPVVVPMSKPDVDTYAAGDRCALKIEDRWVDIDLKAVRILEKIVSPDDESGKVTMTLDLNDFELPEADTSGVGE